MSCIWSYLCLFKSLFRLLFLSNQLILQIVFGKPAVEVLLRFVWGWGGCVYWMHSVGSFWGRTFCVSFRSWLGNLTNPPENTKHHISIFNRTRAATYTHTAKKGARASNSECSTETPLLFNQKVHQFIIDKLANVTLSSLNPTHSHSQPWVCYGYDWNKDYLNLYTTYNLNAFTKF